MQWERGEEGPEAQVGAVGSDTGRYYFDARALPMWVGRVKAIVDGGY